VRRFLSIAVVLVVGPVGVIHGGDATAAASLADQASQNEIADLSLEETAPDGFVGVPMTYTAVVTNKGPNTALAVQIVFGVPTEPGDPVFQWAVADRVSRPCFWNPPVVDKVDCKIGSLDPGETATATLSIVPDVAGVLTVTARAATTVTDPDPRNDADTVTATISRPVQTSTRKITLALSGRLRASGMLTASDGYPLCVGSAAVVIQRLSGSSWRGVVSARTNATGRYTTGRFANRAGRYRAVARGYSVGDHVCETAISRSVVIR